MFATISVSDLDNIHGGGMVRNLGVKIGFGAGVAVTGGLALVPGWNQQVPGQPQGFQKRHQPVVGPKIGRHADSLSPGLLKDFTSGLASGATEAPGWSFQHGI